jgi:hypothetical protein
MSARPARDGQIRAKIVNVIEPMLCVAMDRPH